MAVSSKQVKLETCLNVSSFLLNTMLSACESITSGSNALPKFQSAFVIDPRRKWEIDKLVWTACKARLLFVEILEHSFCYLVREVTKKAKCHKQVLWSKTPSASCCYTNEERKVVWSREKTDRNKSAMQYTFHQQLSFTTKDPSTSFSLSVARTKPCGPLESA